MPGFDQLNDIPDERRAALLQSIRTLQEREGQGGQPSQGGQLQLTITRLGSRHRFRPRLRRGRAAAALGAAVLGAAALAGIVAMLLARPAGHGPGQAGTLPAPRTSVSPGQGAQSGEGTQPGQGAQPGQGTKPGQGISPTGKATPSPVAATTPPAPAPSASRPAHPVALITQITGIGCPGRLGHGITLDATLIGFGWATAGGGWTGNGCNGSSAWTVGTYSLTGPSTLTWAFSPAAGTSHCTLAVYVPSQNATGDAQYTIAGSSGTLATVLVNQAPSAGRWVTLGTYPVAGPAMTVRFGPAPSTLATWLEGFFPVAASTARATCS
jgi:hypothetical protein